MARGHDTIFLHRDEQREQEPFDFITCLEGSLLPSRETISTGSMVLRGPRNFTIPLLARLNHSVNFRLPSIPGRSFDGPLSDRGLTFHPLSAQTFQPMFRFFAAPSSSCQLVGLVSRAASMMDRVLCHLLHLDDDLSIHTPCISPRFRQIITSCVHVAWI